MRTLIYKRTHKGDPDNQGCFGIQDWMGKVRGYDFDAVIGVGGKGVQAKAAGIARRLNWVGIGARKEPCRRKRGPQIKFNHFVLYEEKGVELRVIAPKLAERIYSGNVPRFLFNDRLNKEEQKEINRILKMAKTKRPSEGAPRRQVHVRSGRYRSGRC
jgi:hypothetical protein